ncbi:hypothetical protein AVEN_230937-1 [Araneus ventricosus]|uniref:Uncharacterized protein n=1 Tax=Araneus ventricosus TaxID=182803 RepID=A0A4Y2A2K9_ARAVE|nr:hypothetical protein AVEN_230937-1 [Araneus ventricosus]
MFFSSLDVPTEFVPLSEYIVLGRPLREINLLRASMKFAVDKEVTSSKCTARKTAQVKSTIQDFDPFLRKRGPHKSTPVISKISASLTLSSGNYEAVFHSWLDEDIIEEVQKNADMKNEHYLPHHPVYKDNSTTKIRPVFDGSAKEKNSSSINECLQKGPNMSCPNNAITIPRIELLACAIGSRLVNTTKSDLGLEDAPICCWSDSVNALYWIKGKENWGTFVNNRVQEIRRLTNPEDWKYIAGILNPADLPSRVLKSLLNRYGGRYQVG